MVLLKWTSGDTITERSANNKGVRKGTETEIGCIASADREDGDLFYNSTTGYPQMQTCSTLDERGNLTTGTLGADANEVTVCGVTATQVKSLSYIKNTAGNKGNQLTILAEIKTDNVGTCGNFRVRLCSACADSLVLSTVSATFEIKTGTIDISGVGDGRRTIEFFMDDGACDIITNRELEVYTI